MISVKDQIERLVDLQKIDRQIYKLREERAHKPQELEEETAKFKMKQEGLKRIEEKSKEVQLERKEKELELSRKEEGIKKLQIQLYQVKTNKEYQAMQAEIAGLKADGSVLEEKIIKNLEDLDKLKEGLAQEKSKLAQDESRLNEIKRGIENRIKEIEVQLQELNQKREKILPQIEAETLKHYQRILENRKGIAVVEVKNDSCQGCFINVSPQTINRIKMKEGIVTCSMCGRILYIEE